MLAAVEPSPSATSKTRQKKNGSGGARSRRELFARPHNRRRSPPAAFARRSGGLRWDLRGGGGFQRFASLGRLEFDAPPKRSGLFNASGRLSGARGAVGAGEAGRRGRAPVLQGGVLSERYRQLAAREITSKALAWGETAPGAGR